MSVSPGNISDYHVIGIRGTVLKENSRNPFPKTSVFKKRKVVQETEKNIEQIRDENYTIDEVGYGDRQIEDIRITGIFNLHHSDPKLS